MKKRAVWVAAMMSLSLSGMAQQVLPKDVAGDKEYARVCKEYELKSENSIELLEAYLKQYPDSRHANRVESMIASVYFDQGNYQEAIAIYRSCELDALADKERDDAALKLATAYLKVGDLEEATVWFTLLKDISKTHQADAVYNLGYPSARVFGAPCLEPQAVHAHSHALGREACAHIQTDELDDACGGEELTCLILAWAP